MGSGKWEPDVLCVNAMAIADLTIIKKPPNILQHTYPPAMKKRKIKRPGKVQKIIKPLLPEQPEKAEIAVEGADHLYREIRIENRLEDEQGNEVKLKEGADVDVVVEADADATVPAHPTKKRPKRD
jgi:hypothetical protein